MLYRPGLWIKDFFGHIDAIFIGRKSYEMMQQQSNNDNEDAIPGMPALIEYVFSTTLTSIKKGAILISENAIAEARKIKEQPGKDIWLFGGASLYSAFMKEGLVDELWMCVHPILLGRGKPLFHEQDARCKLRLLESKTYETGLVSIRYSIENN